MTKSKQSVVSYDNIEITRVNTYDNTKNKHDVEEIESNDNLINEMLCNKNNDIETCNDNDTSFTENIKNSHRIVKNKKLSFLGYSIYENMIDEKFVTYETILKNEELYKSFYKHAKKNYSDNNLLFLKEIEELKSLTKKKACEKKANDIINKYVIDDSFYQINSDFKKRGNVALGIGKCKSCSDYIKLFDDLYSETKINVEQELLYSYKLCDSFKRIKKKINFSQIESIEKLSVNDVAIYIESIFENSNFMDKYIGKKYSKIFFDNEINGVCLKHINDEHLDKLGITIIGHKLYIIDNIQFKQNSSSKKKTSICTIF